MAEQSILPIKCRDDAVTHSLHESFFKTGSKAPSKLKILEVKKAAKMTAKRKSRGTPGPPKFLQAPSTTRRFKTDANEPSKKTSAPKDASAAWHFKPEGIYPLPQPPAPRPSLIRSLLQPAEGKGKGQCVPPRPSPLEPSEANANSEIPPLRSGK